ncbi:MAG: PilZ domain-containing protein [Bdellovibrionales bacterium]|nr:PilZ domain-containing protein [Bdellovibrionales bacterium]
MSHSNRPKARTVHSRGLRPREDSSYDGDFSSHTVTEIDTTIDETETKTVRFEQKNGSRIKDQFHPSSRITEIFSAKQEPESNSTFEGLSPLQTTDQIFAAKPIPETNGEDSFPQATGSDQVFASNGRLDSFVTTDLHKPHGTESAVTLGPKHYKTTVDKARRRPKNAKPAHDFMQFNYEQDLSNREKRVSQRQHATNKILIYKKGDPNPTRGYLIDLSSEGFLIAATGLRVTHNDRVVIEVLGNPSLAGGTFKCSVAYTRKSNDFSGANQRHFGLQILNASSRAIQALKNYSA